MSSLRQTLFDLLFNVILQVTLFAVIAASLSAFASRLKARQQNFFYLAVLALCLVAPAWNTFSPKQRLVAAQTQDEAAKQTSESHFHWLLGPGFSAGYLFEFTPRTQSALIPLWAALCVYQIIRLARALRRVSDVRRSAIALCAEEAMMARHAAHVPHRVSLQKSTSISDPVTVGFFRPTILLPCALLSHVAEPELRAVLVHECAHIRRHDYLVHTLCEVLCLPVAWHPGTQYLMSKISQTRELACDEDAAAHFRDRRQYARALVRLASLCLASSRGGAVGIGLFNVDNLEDRIMKLTQKRNPLTRLGLGCLSLAVGLAFTSGAVLARATSLHAQSASQDATASFAGTWHWMFKDRSFATMVLIPDGSAFKGTVTGSKIALDDDGNLSKADASDNAAPMPITKAAMEGKGLRVTVMDSGEPFEFVVTVKDGPYAEIRPVGAPPNMKPILAERMH